MIAMKLPAFLNRLRRDEHGAAIVEFALLGPAFLLMLMGVLQVGMAMVPRVASSQ